jgi:thiol:disulfide interchange protein DsbG
MKQRHFFRPAILLSLLSVFIVHPNAGFAQSSGAGLPSLPTPIQNLVDEGAQIRYLGNDHGLDAWITIKNGQEQYFYVQPDGKSFVMGLLFDDGGELITVDQVTRLRGEGDSVLDALANDDNFSKPKQDSIAFKTPSERLFHDIENSNWVPLGKPNAPVIYSFIDPQCPHCHAFVDDARRSGALENGQMQLRLVPVGFKEETRAQAAFLIASPNPQKRWFAHMDGDETALPAKSEINQQGVQRNLAIMQSWDFNVTPLSVYRGMDGTVKIIRGKPKDLNAVLSDLK